MICKNCGSEVSPYITECPYCGNRLRKRAPKLDRDGPRGREAPQAAPPAAARCRACAAARFRASARVAALRDDRAGRRSGCVGCLLWRTSLLTLDDIAVSASPAATGGGCSPRRSSTRTPATRSSALGAIGLFGWLLERRHGPSTVLALFAGRRDRRGCGDRRGLPDSRSSLGANGAALALLCAWVGPRPARRCAPARRSRRPARHRRVLRRRRADAAGRARGQLARRRRRDRGRVRARAAARALTTASTRGASCCTVPIDGPQPRGTYALSAIQCRRREAVASASPELRSPDRARPPDQPPDHRARHPPGRVDRRQQPAGGHRVAHEPAQLLGHVVGERGERPRRTRGFAACPRPRRLVRAASSSSTPSIAGTAAASTSAATPLASASSCRWPSSPNPVTSVIPCTPAAERRRGAVAVQRGHHVDRLGQRRVARPALHGGRHRARAQRLGQHQRVAGPAAGVGDAPRRVRPRRSPPSRTSARRRRSSGRRRSPRRPRRPPRRRRAGSPAAPRRRARPARTRPGSAR